MLRIVVIAVVQLGGWSRKCSFHWLSRINCTLHHNGVSQRISRIRWVKRKRGLSRCCSKIVLPSISHSCGNYEALSRSSDSSHWRHQISGKIDWTANSLKRTKSRFRKTCKKESKPDAWLHGDNCKDLRDPLHMEQARKHEYIGAQLDVSIRFAR